jgi:hypothetical protein
VTVKIKDISRGNNVVFFLFKGQEINLGQKDKMRDR